MQPSPFAVDLVDQVRPLLRSMQRMLAPKSEFDPATSTRTFRLAVPDVAMSIYPGLTQTVLSEAPGVTIEWVGLRENLMTLIAEEQVDVGVGPAALPATEGVSRETVGKLEWEVFARREHPALARWGRKAWSAWPHLVVSTSSRVVNPVGLAAEQAGLVRRIGCAVPTFALVGSMLADTDLIATLPRIVMDGQLERYGLSSRSVPFVIDGMPHAIMWSSRLGNDEASLWIRSRLLGALQRGLSGSNSRPLANRPVSGPAAGKPVTTRAKDRAV